MVYSDVCSVFRVFKCGRIKISQLAKLSKFPHSSQSIMASLYRKAESTIKFLQYSKLVMQQALYIS